jgi:hypothetical protein
MRLIFICLLSLVAGLALSTSTVTAEDTEFTVTMRANYDFNILGGTSLNPGPDTGYIPFAAVGDVTFELDPSINDPTADPVPILNFTGELQGTPPSPMNLLPHFITPNVMFVGGNLEDIVRDPMTGEVLSAKVVNLEAQWKMVGEKGSDINGLELVTGGSDLDPTSHLPFFGEINAIPFALDDVIKGPDVVDPGLPDEAFQVFLGTELVVKGRARTLTVIIPEPASVTLTVMLFAGLAVGCGRRWRSLAR